MFPPSRRGARHARSLALAQFLGRHEPPSRTMACYGKNWARLAALKRRYDPDGFFKNNFWPLDRAGAPVAPLYNEPPSPPMSEFGGEN